MDRFSYRSLGTWRGTNKRQSGSASTHIVPFGPYGAGQWTGHWIGLVIVVGFFAMGLVGVPEWRGFFLASVILGAILGFVLWLWHQSKGFF